MDTETKNKNKGRWIFVGMIVVAVMVSLLLSFVTYRIINSSNVNNKKEEYYQLSIEDVDSLFEISNDSTLMYDKKSYNMFNDKCLGNDSSALLSFGCYCEKDGVICRSNDKTILTVDGKENIISDSPSSYINILNNVIYYRDDITRKLYSYSVADDKTKCVVDSPCGEVVVSLKGISYVDLATLALKYISFDTMETSQLIEDKIESFAVIGNSYYCLKKDKSFGVVSHNGKFETVATDVDRFFCDGKIIIQKGSNVYLIDDTGVLDTRFNGIEGMIVGFLDDEIYIYENQSVNIYKVSTAEYDKTITEFERSEVLKAFYNTDNTYEIITYSEDSDLYVESQKTISK